MSALNTSFAELLRQEAEGRDHGPSLRLVPADVEVQNLLEARQEIEAMQDRIVHLEREAELFRQRDRVLSQQMASLDEEQRLAARLQRDFLPKVLPEVGSIRFQTLFRPAGYVSGDLFDVARLDEQHVGVYLCDAVGHGMPAALLTMFMRNALTMKQVTPSQGTVGRGYRLLEPNETIGLLNESLRSQDLSYATFATAVYARFDCAAGTFRFAKGGHPDPMVIKADGTIQEVVSDGGLLGVFDDETFATASANLDPGDRVLFYTDGIELAFCGPEMNTERWKTELANRAHLPTAELLEAFSNAIDNQAGSLAQRDDLTMIIAERSR